MVQNKEIDIIQNWFVKHIANLTESLNLDKPDVTYTMMNGRPSIVIKTPGKIYELNCKIEVE